jgi:ElaB/YqjD/DUF883 family membrane-anchored ribosome-binding protein
MNTTTTSNGLEGNSNLNKGLASGSNTVDKLSTTASTYVNQAASSAHQNIDKLADASHPAIDRAKTNAHAAVDVAEGTAHKAVTTLSNAGSNVEAGVEKIKDVHQRTLNATRTHVRDSPLVSIAAATFAGYVLGRIFGGRSR